MSSGSAASVISSKYWVSSTGWPVELRRCRGMLTSEQRDQRHSPQVFRPLNNSRSRQRRGSSASGGAGAGEEAGGVVTGIQEASGCRGRLVCCGW